MSELNTSQATPDVNVADGKDESIRRVQNAEDVRVALLRCSGEPRIIFLVKNIMRNNLGAIWIWGKKGLCIWSVMDSEIDGRFAWCHWFYNEGEKITIKEVVNHVRQWAREHYCTRMAAAVDSEGPWTRLTGFKPWKLVISEEL